MGTSGPLPRIGATEAMSGGKWIMEQVTYRDIIATASLIAILAVLIVLVV